MSLVLQEFGQEETKTKQLYLMMSLRHRTYPVDDANIVMPIPPMMVDISLIITNVNLMVALQEKSMDHQSQETHVCSVCQRIRLQVHGYRSHYLS